MPTLLNFFITVNNKKFMTRTKKYYIRGKKKKEFKKKLFLIDAKYTIVVHESPLKNFSNAFSMSVGTELIFKRRESCTGNGNHEHNLHLAK